MSENDAATRRFRAFISYSHADAAAARRLHRALEQYRVPRRLVGQATPQGPVPRRLAPIFRDREELAAAADLGAHIRDALAASDALVVLCSPTARVSPWVEREVALFRAQSPDRPVLAALLDGEPAQAFPDSMRVDRGAVCEPIAADFRPRGDGPRLARLKLIAGLTGLDLDALIQRDAQRRLRRVMAVTLAASIAALGMAALLVIAVQARAEAERQHAKAEGLVEFMLTDLRRELKKVGRLDVMEAANRRAIAYYGDATALAALPDDSLERRARLMHALGEDAQTSGDQARALIWFRDADAATRTALARRPRDPKAILAQAQSDYWIGSVYRARKEWPQAEIQYRRYAAGAARLIALDPANPDYMMEMGWSAQDLGVVAQGRRDPAAEPLLRAGVAWISRAGQKRPGDFEIQSALANAYADLADSYYERRLWRQALAIRWRQYRIDQQIVDADPSDAGKIYTLATAERSVGRVSLRAGDAATAATMTRSAYARSQWLVAHDPKNSEWSAFDTRVACDLLDIAPAAQGPTLTELRRRIAAAVARFRSQGNPVLADIPLCVQRVAAAPAAE
ncbi:TIR domain-containing protein [Sphingomonas sp. KR3-1]|uniref:TIR domain-containing protein n=1 Tax=Sphingomonas sp. KR3-1 TaxID=3156611 RepID=UPI0032B34DF8